MAGSGVMILRWAGRLMCLAGLAAWVLWLAWRVTAGPVTVVGLAVLALEVGAFAVACVLTAALWSVPVRSVRSGGATSYAALPDVVQEPSSE